MAMCVNVVKTYSKYQPWHQRYGSIRLLSGVVKQYSQCYRENITAKSASKKQYLGVNGWRRSWLAPEAEGVTAL